jgi:hypothetical protein
MDSAIVAIQHHEQQDEANRATVAIGNFDTINREEEEELRSIRRSDKKPATKRRSEPTKIRRTRTTGVSVTGTGRRRMHYRNEVLNEED